MPSNDRQEQTITKKHVHEYRIYVRTDDDNKPPVIGDIAVEQSRGYNACIGAHQSIISFKPTAGMWNNIYVLEVQN